MKLQNDTFLTHFAFGTKVPTQTSLCALFWRCVGKGAGLLGFLFLVGMLILSIGKLVYIYWRELLFPVLPIGIAMGVIVLATVALTKYLNRNHVGDKITDALGEKIDAVAESSLWSNLVAMKHGICPIIQISGVKIPKRQWTNEQADEYYNGSGKWPVTK